MQKRAVVLLSALVLALVVAPIVDAAMVRKMDLAEMCQRADRVFRGRVLSVQSGTVTAGGGELPTVTYRLEVGEQFQGEFTQIKGDKTYTEVTMLGTLKNKNAEASGLERFSFMPELPTLKIGEEYVLLTTAPSAVGLSTTVGLGQGCFHISQSGKDEMTVNELGNAALSETINGAVSYDVLAQELRAALSQ